MKLTDICTVQLGYTPKGRLEPVEGDGTRAVQLRDTAPEGGRSIDAIGQYMLDPIPPRYLASQGDVVFRSRGDRNTATALTTEFGEPAVAVMPLVIIRPNSNLATPDYIAWFINQPATQRYFDGCARGTGMRMIPVGCLADLEVPLPDLTTQHAIANVDKLASREFALSRGLADKRRQLTAFALLNRAHRNIDSNTTGRLSASGSMKEGAK